MRNPISCILSLNGPPKRRLACVENEMAAVK